MRGWCRLEAITIGIKSDSKKKKKKKKNMYRPGMNLVKSKPYKYGIHEKFFSYISTLVWNQRIPTRKISYR